MTSLQAKRKTIDDYLEGVSVHQRKALQKLRQAIHAVAPKAKECISYGIPAFRLNGRSLVFFAAWANHCALYPGSSELRDFQTSKGTIRFSPGNPLPVPLVRKLVKARIAENNNKNRSKP